jgi:hypothetical protein
LGIVRRGPTAAVVAWTAEEDDAIKLCYASAVAMFGASVAPRVVASHAVFRENKRTQAQLFARAKHVLTERDTDTDTATREDVSASALSVVSADVVKLLGGGDLREWVARKTEEITVSKTGPLARAARGLLNCQALAEDGASVLTFLKEQLVLASAQRTISESAPDCEASFALVVPARGGMRKAWAHARVVALLNAMEMQAPGPGERFWRVPGWFSANALNQLSEALSQAVLGSPTDAEDDSPVVTTVAKPSAKDGNSELGFDDDDDDDDDDMAMVRKGVEQLWKPPYFMNKVDTVAWMEVKEPPRAAAPQMSDNDESASDHNSRPAEVDSVRPRVRGGDDSDVSMGSSHSSSRRRPAVAVQQTSRRLKAVALVSSSEEDEDSDADGHNRDQAQTSNNVNTTATAASTTPTVVALPKARSSRMVVESESDSE